MTLEKAIEISAKDPRELTHFEMPDYLTAVKLGNEALKARLNDKKCFFIDLDNLLPGETKE